MKTTAIPLPIIIRWVLNLIYNEATQKSIFMITTEKEYNALVARVEELLQNPDNIENREAKGYVELTVLSDLVADYEEQYYPVEKPSLIDVIKLRMTEMKLNQKRLSELLGISSSRVSEYLNGKSEPPLQVAREISRKLNIEASIVLGV